MSHIYMERVGVCDDIAVACVWLGVQRCHYDGCEVGICWDQQVQHAEI